jgi:hypothetical protein
VVVMKDEAEVVIEYAPLDWILSNKLIRHARMGHLSPEWSWRFLRPWSELKRCWHPTLLGRVPCRSSSFQMGNLRITDHLWKRWEIASTYRRRRLTVCCVGIAQDSDDEIALILSTRW